MNFDAPTIQLRAMTCIIGIVMDESDIGSHGYLFEHHFSCRREVNGKNLLSKCKVGDLDACF